MAAGDKDLALVQELHEETSRLESLHGVKFNHEALLLATRISNRDREKAIDILNKACECSKEEKREDIEKELYKLKYTLRRALFEYKQLIKENAPQPPLSGLGVSWLSWVEKELKLAFYDLVSFLKTRVIVNHDEFASDVHEAAKVKDYSLILKFGYEFKPKLVVGFEEIAEVVGIPASWFIIKTEEERYKRLQVKLEKRVIGQRGVIDRIIKSLLRQKGSSESESERRPLGLFMLEGPYGVGKSELAKVIADELYDNENRLVRFNMATYIEPNSVSGLVGSVTETVKTMPYSVLLFDKIEKADYSVFRTLVSVFLRDATIIDFSKTLIIMTSDVEEDRSLSGKDIDEATSSLFPIELRDKRIMMGWPYNVARLSLRKWAAERSMRQDDGYRAVIVCPTASALVAIRAKAGGEYITTTGKIIKRWMDDNVFPQLSKMLADADANAEGRVIAENITIYIDAEVETGELSFKLITF